METDDKSKLDAFRSQLVDDLGDSIESLLDNLIEAGLLSPQRDDYQNVCAGQTARDRARLLLDCLPTLGPDAYKVFVQSLAKVRPHLAVLLSGEDQLEDESVCKGTFPPARPVNPLARRIQNILRTSYVQRAATTTVLDHRRTTVATGLDRLFVTISSLNFEEAQAQFQEKKKALGAKGKPVSGASQDTREIWSKTFASRCTDERELSDLGVLFRCGLGNGVRADSCLLVGPAGAGKSILLDWVAMSWAEGRVDELGSFEIVLRVNARDTEALDSDTAVGVLVSVLRQHGIAEEDLKRMAEYMEKHSARILVLLDAADEGGDAWAKSKGLKMLLERRSMGKCTFVITSRPCSLAYELVPLCKQRQYLVGFSDDRLDELIVRRLGEEKGQQVVCRLKEPARCHVRELMKHTPLVANMVTELIEEDDDLLPSNMTQIYAATAANMVCRQQGTNSDGRVVLARLEDLPSDVTKMLQSLGEVALAGLKRKQFVFSMKSFVDSCSASVLGFGFMEEFEHVSLRHGHSHNVEFRHLTWLEFLAAYSLTQQTGPSCSAVKMCAQEVGVGEESRPFWRFVCGMVKVQHLEEVVESLHTVFNEQTHSEVEKEAWAGMACSCIAEAAQQQSVDFSAENRAAVEKAAAAVIPDRISLVGGKPSVEDLQTMSIALHHSPHVDQLGLGGCNLKANHFFALAGGLTHVKTCMFFSDPGLHGDGLKALVKSQKSSDILPLEVLSIEECNLQEEDCGAITELMCMFPLLTGLNLSSNHLGTLGIAQLENSLIRSRLEFLILDDNDLDSEAGSILGRVLQENQHIRMLCVSNNRIGNDGVGDLLKEAQESQSLKFLDLNHTGVDAGVLDAVVMCLLHRSTRRAQTESLQSFTISMHGNEIGRVALEAFVQCLPDDCQDCLECDSFVVENGVLSRRDYSVFFQQYTEENCIGNLDIIKEGVDDEGASEIAHLLKENQDVQALTLNYNSVGDEGTAALAGALEINNTLRGLSLHWNRVGSDGFIAMATSLVMCNRTLLFLDLGRNPIFTTTNDEARRNLLHTLGKLISEPTALLFLGLGDTSLGDKECCVIGKALKSFQCSLCFLDLDQNGITDIGVTELCRGLERNTTVKYLDLSDNQITNEGVEVISKCLQSRDQQGKPLQRVWMEDNRAADPRRYTGCMVDASFAYTNISDYIKTYLEFE